MAESPDLPSLLRSALAGLERAHIDQGAGTRGLPSLAQWANLLRVLDEAGTDRRELPALLRLSRRAVRSGISAAVRRGWVSAARTGRAQEAVMLTASGSDVAARWALLRESAETQWQGHVGDEGMRDLRTSLARVVTSLPLEYPHYPAGYGAADARITGGNGQDWKAVARREGDTVSGLPVSALVSQALVAFAMAYEEKSEVALSWSATVIMRIPSGGCPAKGLGSTAALPTLERHGFLRSVDDEHGPILRLTARGRAVRDAYGVRVDAVEEEWRHSFGEEMVTELRRALASVAGKQQGAGTLQRRSAGSAA